MSDPFAQLKAIQKKGWAFFQPLETTTAIASPRLVKFAGIAPGQRVLDVGCGTGVAALTAARLGARATGVDLTPELVAHAKENAALAQVEIDFREGDVEALPFGDAVFDVVISQFGHMFAPRPDLAVREMLRVLKTGGTIAFATWPPELFTGSMVALIGRYMPPLPPGAALPPQWGDPKIVRERLGDAVKDVFFDRDLVRMPALSPQHVRAFMERTVGPILILTQSLASDPGKLAAFRREMDALIELHFDQNSLKQDYLLSRAVKA
jgi:SAM-dependent methyltransferase